MKIILRTSVMILFGFLLYPDSHAQDRRRIFNTSENSNIEYMRENGLQTLLSGSLTDYYFEGFEKEFPPTGWQIIDELDVVNTWTSSTNAELPAAFEGSKSAHCKYAYPGPTGIDWLISPKYTVAAGDSLSFYFKLEYTGYIPDSTFILISTTDSSLSSFKLLIDFYAEGLNYPDNATTWYYKTYSLDSFEGQDIYIAFKNVNTLGNGIFIDNVEIGTRPAAQAAVTKINIDDFYPSGISNPTAIIKNKGSIEQTIQVTMSISDGYVSNKSIIMPPQSAVQVAFDLWTAAIGKYSIHVQTNLAGDTVDIDDTLSIHTTVLEPFLNYGWSQHDPLPIPTVGVASASICSSDNSKYYMLGGVKGTNQFTADAYEYDLAFGTWAAIDPMPAATGFAATGVANHKFIVAGGEIQNAVIGATQIYDYQSASWSLGRTVPTPVVNMAYGMYNDSLLYLIGGRKANGEFTNVVQMYDVYTNTWSLCTLKPGDLTSGLRGGISGNKIVITGGYSNTAGKSINTTYVGEIDVNNPTSITWTQGADYPLDAVRFPGAGVSLDALSGLVIFSGGTSTDVFSEVTNKTFAFDVNTGTWKLGANKPTASHYFNLIPVVENDTLYLAALGGGDGSFQIDKNEWLNLGRYEFSTSVIENDFIAELELFPNPTYGESTLSLNLKKHAVARLQVLDVLGNIVRAYDENLESGLNKVSIEITDLLPGMYFCTINIEGNCKAIKVVKK